MAFLKKQTPMAKKIRALANNPDSVPGASIELGFLSTWISQ